jgi:hypothetical protein
VGVWAWPGYSSFLPGEFAVSEILFHFYAQRDIFGMFELDFVLFFSGDVLDSH